MVVALILLGPVAALVVYFGSGPLYESRAKLLVKYVFAVSPAAEDEELNPPSSDRSHKTIVGAEIEILTSLDLANQVVEEMGVERLAPNGASGEESRADAVEVIMSGLEVEAAPESSLITLRFRHSDPELVVTILETMVEQYFVKHLEIHRGYGDADAKAREIKREMEEKRTEWKGLEEQLRELTQDAESDPDVVHALAASQLRIELELRKMKFALNEVRRGSRSIPNIDIVQRPSVATRGRDEGVITLAITLAVVGPVLGVILGLIVMRKRS